jgi:hypothetical protein
MVEETGIPRENHWQTLSHHIVSSTPHHGQDSNSINKNSISQLVAEIKREQNTIQKWCLVQPVNRDEFLVKSKPKKIIKPRRLWKGHHSDQF